MANHRYGTFFHAEEFALEGMFGKGPEIGSLASARQLARKLFDNLETHQTENDKEGGDPVIVVEDFLPVRRQGYGTGTSTA